MVTPIDRRFWLPRTKYAKWPLSVRPHYSRTYLGASTSLSLEDVDLNLLKNTKIVYLEGYLFDLPEAKNLFNIIVDKQKHYSYQVALSLSDPFCVERHKEDFLKLIKFSNCFQEVLRFQKVLKKPQKVFPPKIQSSQKINMFCNRK